MPCSVDRGAPDRRDPRGGAAPRLGDQSGFTLIEVLVAFVAMTTLVGVLYRGVVQTRVGAVDFGQRMGNEAVALSLLDDFRARRDLGDGRYRGERDGRRWTLTASGVDLSAQLPRGAGPDSERQDVGRPDSASRPTWTMQRLVLQVEGKGRPLESEALHLVRAPPKAAGAR